MQALRLSLPLHHAAQQQQQRRRTSCAAPRACTAPPPAFAASSAAAPRSRPVARAPAARRGVVARATKKTFPSFDAMIAESETPVLVDFYAVWCGPCQMLAPILGEVTGALGETVRVVKIDTEKYPALASKYSISALPTLVLFKGGKPVDRIEGLPTAAQLIARVRSYL